MKLKNISFIATLVSLLLAAGALATELPTFQFVGVPSERKAAAILIFEIKHSSQRLVESQHAALLMNALVKESGLAELPQGTLFTGTFAQWNSGFDVPSLPPLNSGDQIEFAVIEVSRQTIRGYLKKRIPAAKIPRPVAATLYPTVANALRGARSIQAANENRISASEITPQSPNYVMNTEQGKAGNRMESRTFFEFDLQARPAKSGRAKLVFSVFRYNTPHLPDQVITVYGYDGNGVVNLANWKAEARYVGSTGAIAGYKEDRSNQGALVDNFAFDISKLYAEAIAREIRYLGFYLSNPEITRIDSSDPLGYSSLLTVGNYQILVFEPDPPADEMTSGQ